MELLPMYNFVVTQDEDYLNLICHNKVCWLPQKWNVEVFGQIPCREEEICVVVKKNVGKGSDKKVKKRELPFSSWNRK